MRRLLALLALGFLSVASAGAAQAAPEVKVADNVFVVPDANAKATTFWMIVKAGCDDEPHGNCHGLAHYLEHLIFLGRNADHKTTAMRFFPDGETNGSTTHISTVFWQKFPRRPDGQTGDLEKLFRFYTDHLQGLEVSDEEGARERNVVMQEYNMRVGRSPGRRFFSELNRKLHPLHPQGQDPIGSKEDIQAFTVAEAKAFHKDWYVRDNAVFVVHGPVDVEAVKGLAAKYVSALPNRQTPDRAWRNALLDLSPLDVTEQATEKDVRSVSLGLSRIVRAEESDARRSRAARSIASAFLRSALPGSPTDELVDRKDLASGIDSSEISRVIAGVLDFSLWATPREGVSPETLLAAVNAYVTELAAKGVSSETVERLKKRAADARADLAKDPAQVAAALVNWFGAHNSYQDYAERDQIAAAVSAADVNALFAALAKPARQIAGILTPEP